MQVPGLQFQPRVCRAIAGHAWLGYRLQQVAAPGAFTVSVAVQGGQPEARAARGSFGVQERGVRLHSALV